ncbi:DUF6665 family protein [Labrys monachus]|uniref:Uncharacterized protein n=1 Tax=Labrys monachus TaxID=217067 RepID=A0ABU0FK44_9HYPH|nr:DUF6665 family protein [Labrys monachus]MDQ0394977.1 hypothetical protein [Labrys monachus]
MTLRLPQNISGLSTRTAVDVMAAEIRVEKAISLERTGEAAGKAVAALKAAAPSDPERPRLLAEAAEAVWGYFIQRELMGQGSHAAVIRDMGIPREVIARLGARPKTE